MIQCFPDDLYHKGQRIHLFALHLDHKNVSLMFRLYSSSFMLSQFLALVANSALWRVRRKNVMFESTL